MSPLGPRGTLRALVVDDEPLARQTLRLLLARDAEIELAGECSGVEAPALIETLSPDIVFLDVQMPEVDGFDVIDAVGAAAMPVVVFVTAYDDYALRAFDAAAVDYLLKPFDDARFARALARAKERARAGSPGGAAGAAARATLATLTAQRRPAWVERFLVRKRDRTVVVAARDVDWIEAADYYVSLHVGAATHLLRESLADLEQRLDPERFLRVHRGAIVNLTRVREIHPLAHGDCLLALEGGARVRLSRSRREPFEQRFAGGA